MTGSDEQSREATRFSVARGGRPTPEEAAALAVAVELVLREPAAADVGTEAPSDEWALQGRMHALGWQPLLQRWPGEPPGRSWRRVVD